MKIPKKIYQNNINPVTNLLVRYTSPTGVIEIFSMDDKHLSNSIKYFEKKMMQTAFDPYYPLLINSLKTEEENRKKFGRQINQFSETILVL
jgi:hypothetical protein